MRLLIPEIFMESLDWFYLSEIIFVIEIWANYLIFI